MECSSLYTDMGMSSLPHTIAMMGGPFAGFDDMDHRNKRMRTDASTSSSSSSGENSSSSAEDKRMLERERNRRQARKSRTLKRQCADRMQKQLDELHKEADAAEAKNKQAAKELADCRDARRRVLRKVFDLRAEGCTDEDVWLEVLSPDLRLTMPITPYRSFNPADVINNRRVLLGVDGIISDTQSLRVTRDNIGVKTAHKESPVSVKYVLGSDSEQEGAKGGAYFNKNGIMCTFVMRTLDAVAHGACNECESKGMVRARFNSENKIEELDIAFDAIACHQQLMLAAGKKEFPLVPNTLENALKDEKSRIVVTTPRHPFRITHVNRAWTNLCGFELEECKGKSLSILQGPETDMARVNDLCKLSQKGYAASMIVTNRNKKGELFRNHLRCYPVSSEDPEQISHIVGMLTAIPGEGENIHPKSLPPVQAF